LKGDVREAWDAHWARLARPASTFGRIASLVREQILSRAVLSYVERYLPRDGVLVEMGCGSAESSARIPRSARHLAALDFSAGALRQASTAGIFDSFVQGDLERLPFGAGTIDGAWNLGVLEHFEQEKGIRILSELRRVLKPGGTAVLFWPPEFGSSRIVLAPIEAIRSRANGRPFLFFPDEVNRLRSKGHALEIVKAAGLEPVAVDFSPRAAFIHIVVVARRAVQ
jgi:SAM-dependent methyltransferase